jgi:hypothetical protein
LERTGGRSLECRHILNWTWSSSKGYDLLVDNLEEVNVVTFRIPKTRLIVVIRGHQVAGNVMQSSVNLGQRWLKEQTQFVEQVPGHLAKRVMKIAQHFGVNEITLERNAELDICVGPLSQGYLGFFVEIPRIRIWAELKKDMTQDVKK